MTKDELRKEATFTVEWESTPMIDRPLFVHAYITGAEPREKRIAELELKIKHLTEHLEPQAMTALFEQVEEEEVKQEQRIEKLEKENVELKQEKIPQLERKIASIRGAHSVDCKKLNARIEQVKRLQDENVELRDNVKLWKKASENNSYKAFQLENENAELKARAGLSIDCEKAQKNGELCLGYGGDEDEPCEKCKNCIKCEGGYYQLGETEKDEQLTKAESLITRLSTCFGSYANNIFENELLKEAEQFLKEVSE